MNDPGQHAAPTTDDAAAVARILSDLRKANSWTLSEVSRRTGVSISTLSKIENGQSRPAYSVLTRLASGLDIDFADLLGGEPPQARFSGAARAITRAGRGKHFGSEMGLYEMLATDLAAKSLQPMVIDIQPRDDDSPSVRSAHSGEEFVYVLEGDVVFEMNPYAPVVLAAGDSAYFDAAMDHGFYAVGPKPGRILSICFAGSAPKPTESLEAK